MGIGGESTVNSENGTQGATDEQCHLDAGTQLLVSTTTMQDSLSLLPAAAFQHLLIVSSNSPAALEQTLVEGTINLSGIGVVPVSGSPVEYDGDLWTSKAVFPDDLTGLSMRVTSALDALDALDPGQGWVLFDTLNALFMYARRERVCRSFDHVTRAAAERDVRGVYTVAGDALDDEAYASLRRSVDRTVSRQ